MTRFENSGLIEGVVIVHLRAFADERGRFMESFRREWFPQRSWDKLQMNRSDSKAGVLRGLHYHQKQVDYWYVPQGSLRAGLVDLRPHSSTYKATQTVELGDDNNVGLFIPIGVAHGFLALTDVTLTYVVDNYYDGGKDEFGVAWNDPSLNLDWQLDGVPLVSQRDAENRLLQDIPVEDLPQ